MINLQKQKVYFGSVLEAPVHIYLAQISLDMW